MLKLVSKGQDLRGSLDSSGVGRAGGEVSDSAQVGAWLDSGTR